MYIIKKFYFLLLFISFYAIIIISRDYLFRKMGLTIFTYIIYPFIIAYKLLMQVMHNEPVQLPLEHIMVLGVLPLLFLINFKICFNPLFIYINGISPRAPLFSCFHIIKYSLFFTHSITLFGIKQPFSLYD